MGKQKLMDDKYSVSPAITVAVTTYNLEKYIDRCFDELINQTFTDFEIVVLDDCSADGTVEKIKLWKAKYPEKIKAVYLDVDLGTPARSKNALLDTALVSGRYTIFLEGDDSIEPDFLEKLYDAAESTGSDIALCSYDRVEIETGHVLCKEMCGFPKTVAFPADTDITAFINGSLWNKLIKSELLLKLREPDSLIGDDVIFTQMLLSRCSRIAFVDKILIHYMVRSTSYIQKIKAEMAFDFAEKLLSFYNTLDGGAFKNALGLAAFIHLGISMPLRVSSTPGEDIKKYLKDINAFFETNFDMFRGNKYLKLKSLSSHGIKGFGIKAAYFMHKINCFGLFLWAYKTYCKVFNTDIKF